MLWKKKQKKVHRRIVLRRITTTNRTSKRTNEKTSGWIEKLRGLSHYKRNIFKIKSRHTDKNVYWKTLLFSPVKKWFFPKYDMGELVEQFLKLGDVKFEKKNFHFAKKAINIGEVDIEKISLSIQFAYGKNKEVDTRQFLAYKTCKNINQYSSHFQKWLSTTPIKLKNLVHVL